jgi:hypothetical protein
VRKPVGVVQLNNGGLTVVCDDGTLWLRIAEETRLRQDAAWQELLPPLPGTEAARGRGTPAT